MSDSTDKVTPLTVSFFFKLSYSLTSDSHDNMRVMQPDTKYSSILASKFKHEEELYIYKRLSYHP